MLLDNKTVAYDQIVPTAEGRAFQLEELLGPEQSSPGVHSVRIELVNVSSVWYAVELEI